MSDQGFPDRDGKPLSQERMKMIGWALRSMQDLTAWERGYVLCWFCSECHAFIPPGGGHACGGK